MSGTVPFSAPDASALRTPQRPGDGLARSGPAELTLAWQRRDTLLAAARTLVATAAHEPGAADCRAARCALVASGAGELCPLAHRLASIEPGPAPATSTEVAAHAFRSAVLAALDAVRLCRQTAHSTGGCWFAASPGVDGCAEVLRLAHRTG